MSEPYNLIEIVSDRSESSDSSDYSSFRLIKWPFEDSQIAILSDLCQIVNLEEGGKTFQPIFQDPEVAYAATWFEHEYRDHDGWQKFGAGWERAKPIPDVRP